MKTVWSWIVPNLSAEAEGPQLAQRDKKIDTQEVEIKLLRVIKELKAPNVSTEVGNN